MSHPSTQTHTSNQGHEHKKTVEQFAHALNGNNFDHLEKYLDNNVQKTIDSQVIYKDLKEAQDYYKKQNTNNKTNQWKVEHFHEDDQQGNTIRAKITFDNKTYNATYSFSTSGKIQRIDNTTTNN
jgi:hypothetical protein